MAKLLLITPPFVQVNCPYPATPYLAGYLRRQGFDVAQQDLSAEVMRAVFSGDFLKQLFSKAPQSENQNLQRIYALRKQYEAAIGGVMDFLSGKDDTLANLICSGNFLPQAARFDAVDDPEYFFGSLGITQCARYMCTLCLQDLSDFIRETVTPHFEIVRYGEQLALSIASFAVLEKELTLPLNIVEQQMIGLLEARIRQEQPDVIGFTIPFPGCLLAALRCAQAVRRNHPSIRIVLGGGYPSTELRQMHDPALFDYVDYVILDDGELPLERILTGGPLLRTFTRNGYHPGEETISHLQRGCPDFDGLPHAYYISLIEVTNPMHRLWSDGRWNKLMLAHGCYWAKCAFCDTSLDYICRFDPVAACQLVDWMEQIVRQTGSRGFHFVDEAAPPRLLKEIALEIIRRKMSVVWWTNIRFETAFTGDLCQLLATSGCIAVSGGLEVASDRLLRLMNKGVGVEQASLALRNFNQAGILTHAYLMYGFPSQTLQESVDSLEVVRQLFHAGWITSGFWHRYAMTLHSPGGNNPEQFGVKRKNLHVNAFANNEIPFAENRGYHIQQVGEALRTALSNYMYGEQVDRPVHKWFTGKTPQTLVSPSLIADLAIQPDWARMYHPDARLIWIGGETRRCAEGIVVEHLCETKILNLKTHDAEFLVHLLGKAADPQNPLTMGQAAEIYQTYTEESFVALFLSKKWDMMRSFGLLQV